MYIICLALPLFSGHTNGVASIWTTVNYLSRGKIWPIAHTSLAKASNMAPYDFHRLGIYNISPGTGSNFNEQIYSLPKYINKWARKTNVIHLQPVEIITNFFFFETWQLKKNHWEYFSLLGQTKSSLMGEISFREKCLLIYRRNKCLWVDKFRKRLAINAKMIRSSWWETIFAECQSEISQWLAGFQVKRFMVKRSGG